MAKDVSFIQYMRAHGNTPAPTQRPLLAGAVSGLAAYLPSAAVLYLSGAAAAAARTMSSNIVTALIVFAALMLMGGMVYAKLFGRAANDRRGGWLFGMSFGFLIWMIGPASFLQLWTAEPMARGVAAMGLFGAHVVHGLVLGMIYPLLSAAFAADLGARPPEHPAGVSKQ